ncbi:MAG: BrnT family toxin [Anaerolineae bacterium]|nr:BrnT family toxin [Anaerolineae bacterium]
MRIDKIIIPWQIQDKLSSKHQVTVDEARQTLLNNPRIRFAEKGHQPGEDVYVALGKTFGGRYLSIFFVYKPDVHTAVIISGRNMTQQEKKQYGRK